MIDFRYHLVSIIAVFLALAVGIALGAGPLEGQLSQTINSEISTLRKDRAELRSELDAAAKSSDKRDAFIAMGNTQLLAGRLSGSTVDVVVLPNADDGVVKATTATLVAAGATLGATVTVRSTFVDEADQNDRDRLGGALLAELGLDAQADAQLPALTRALAGALEPKTTTKADTVRSVMTQLSDAKFLTFTPETVPPATSVVVIAPVSVGASSSDSGPATAYAQLALALDHAGKGTVLISNGGATSVTDSVSVVSTTRADSTLSKGVTTVDDAGDPMGQASIVLGLLEQYDGGFGQYGLAADAAAAYPPLPGN